jgi:hypothetical protein
MYNSQATVPDDQHQASTKLHMDMADAVNIMLWAAPLPDGKPGFAICQIYPPEVSPSLINSWWKKCSRGLGIPYHQYEPYVARPSLGQLSGPTLHILPVPRRSCVHSRKICPSGLSCFTCACSKQLKDPKSLLSWTPSRLLVTMSPFNTSTKSNNSLPSSESNAWPVDTGKTFFSSIPCCGMHGCRSVNCGK